VPRGEVEEGDAERADVQKLDRAVADGLTRVNREAELAVLQPAGDDGGVVDVVVDRADRAVRVGLDRDVVASAALAVEQLVEQGPGALREIAAVSDDGDSRHAPAFEEPDGDRQERHDDREDGEDGRRHVEEPRADELAVLAARDVGRVREGRLVAGRRAVHREAHATSRPGSATTAAPGTGIGRSVGSVAAEWPTWSMKICSSDGSATSKWLTRAPAAMAAARTASGSVPSSSSISVRSMPGRRIRAPGTPASQVSRWSSSTD